MGPGQQAQEGAADQVWMLLGRSADVFSGDLRGLDCPLCCWRVGTVGKEGQVFPCHRDGGGWLDQICISTYMRYFGVFAVQYRYVDVKRTKYLQSRLHSGCVDCEELESGARLSLQVIRWPTLPNSTHRLPLMKCATCPPDEICPTRSTLTDP